MVETTRLVRTETRHDFLLHGYLLQARLYGRQGLTLFGSTIFLFAEHSNIHYARVKANLVIENAVQCTCLRTKSHKSKYLDKYSKKRKMSL